MEFGYSKTTNAFYDMSRKDLFIEAGTWPDDVIEVEQNIADEFMQTPPSGKQRISGDDGLPAWGDIPPPTKEDSIAAAEYERQSRIDAANNFMNSKQWPGKAAIGRLKGDELLQYNLWLDYLDALEAVDTSSAPDIKWPTPPAE
ncbi:tail fiber assembly protein [Citrobacter freundii]|uniref:tail fiber assembly protein n=1 Tax=Citrobacter freundii TaxID=546 RepID=UPI001F4B9C29|nr:tail fiber assembly protein [Citrobacter freundii]MBX8901967.1 tail fiber assembly protein [Citrobacter freundii]